MALEVLMQPNPALRFEKALLNRIDTENIISDLFDRPVENSNYKERPKMKYPNTNTSFDKRQMHWC